MGEGGWSNVSEGCGQFGLVGVRGVGVWPGWSSEDEGCGQVGQICEGKCDSFLTLVLSSWCY